MSQMNLVQHGVQLTRMGGDDRTHLVRVQRQLRVGRQREVAAVRIAAVLSQAETRGLSTCVTFVTRTHR
jgi:hypothetical protein